MGSPRLPRAGRLRRSSQGRNSMDRLPSVKNYNRPRQEKDSRIQQNPPSDLRLQQLTTSQQINFGTLDDILLLYRSCAIPANPRKSVDRSEDKSEARRVTSGGLPPAARRRPNARLPAQSQRLHSVDTRPFRERIPKGRSLVAAQSSSPCSRTRVPHSGQTPETLPVSE